MRFGRYHWRKPTEKKLLSPYLADRFIILMPFGLCNAAQRLCRLMDKVVPASIREIVLIYLDDLLVVSPDLETYFQLLQIVAAGLTINTAKSKFYYKELKYLGYIVRTEVL